MVGSLNVAGGWTQSLRAGSRVRVKDDPRDTLVVVQGGSSCGLKAANIIDTHDPSLTVFAIPNEQLTPVLR